MNDECELSIEETNKLRAKLGLKKLDTEQANHNTTRTTRNSSKANNDGSKTTEKKKKTTRTKNINVNNNDVNNNDVNNDENNDEENNRTTRSSNKNKKTEDEKKIKTISEEFNDDINDVENWVNKTRAIINKKLQEDGIEYSDDENDENDENYDKNYDKNDDKNYDKNYDENNNSKGKSKKKNNFVSNLKVQHKHEDITNGMILTLKDTTILKNKAADDYEDDEENDYLINDELQKQNKNKLLSKNDDSYWNKNYYNPLDYYDDISNNNDNDNNNFNNFNNFNNNKKEQNGIHVIPKYNDEKHSFEVNVKYDEDDESHDEYFNKNDTTTVTKYNNSNDKKTRNKKEWYNTESNNNINKKKRKKKNSEIEKKKENHQKNKTIQQKIPDTSTFNLKKRKINNVSRRKKEEDAWAFLYDQPAEEEEEENEEIKKKNKKNEKKEENEENDKKMNTKTLNYIKPNNQKKHDAKNDSNTSNENANNILKDVLKEIKEEPEDAEFTYFDDMLSDNEEDKELYELLQNGSNFKKRKKENNYQGELLKYIVINEGEKEINEDKENHGVIKLTSTSEFCKNITLPINMQKNEKKTKMKKNEITVISSLENIDEKTKNITGNNYESDKNNNNNNDNNNNDNTNNDNESDNKSNEDNDEYNNISEDGVSEIFNEVKIDEGLCGALNYLKSKGELNIEDKLYRNPENKPLHMSTDKNEIKLDYKNDSGKVMTSKETFRYISWIFHGKKQGKNKLEKKMKRMEIERRFKENPIDSMPTLNVLKKYQQAQKKSYFTLSNMN
ncbi:U4/U6.U5 tri-snRNP-associated protein 1, putative [Hepatocystis sp. ex Piliocolobus tephrosceles]|nr:U4/U6.U5 tri-snRNP-associated protein 1, putative [Hepatocystis sp. ex Piliocolobus tephrosceles]